MLTTSNVPAEEQPIKQHGPPRYVTITQGDNDYILQKGTQNNGWLWYKGERNQNSSHEDTQRDTRRQFNELRNKINEQKKDLTKEMKTIKWTKRIMELKCSMNEIMNGYINNWYATKASCYVKMAWHCHLSHQLFKGWQDIDISELHLKMQIYKIKIHPCRCKW